MDQLVNKFSAFNTSVCGSDIHSGTLNYIDEAANKIIPFSTRRWNALLNCWPHHDEWPFFFRFHLQSIAVDGRKSPGCHYYMSLLWLKLHPSHHVVYYSEGFLWLWRVPPPSCSQFLFACWLFVLHFISSPSDWFVLLMCAPVSCLFLN